MGMLTSLYRGIQLFRHKPAHWRLRPGTVDRRLFREVAIRNEYQLPSRFQPGDVILDIGAHTGSFGNAVLKRGAGTVYCCEADPDNFRLLTHNLKPYGKRAHLLPSAVWRSDIPVTHLHFLHPNDPRNTGAGSVAIGAEGQTVPALAFDELVVLATPSDGRVRLVKLDCEGSEWPILLTARLLHRVDAICGEYHLGEYSGCFAVADYPEFTPAVLERYLSAQGFRVRIKPIVKNPRLGLFFAER